MNNQNICRCIEPGCTNYAYHGTMLPEYCNSHCMKFYNLVGSLDIVNKPLINQHIYQGSIYERFDFTMLYNYIGKILNNSYLMYNKDNNYFYIVDFDSITDPSNKERVINYHTEMINLKFKFVSLKDTNRPMIKYSDVDMDACPDVLFNKMYSTHEKIVELLNG